MNVQSLGLEVILIRKFLIFLLCFCTLFLCFVIPSFAVVHEGSVSNANVPTDLTGYTVTVPAGWSATAGFGSYSISGNISYSSVTDASFSYFRIGYTTSLTMSYLSNENSIAFGDVSLAFGSTSGSVSFSLTNLSGNDVSNPSLIQWLVDNNASFDNGEPDPEPFVSIPAGRYYFNASLEYPSITEIFDGNSSLSFSCDGFYFVGSLPYHFNTFIFELDSYLDDENYRVYVSVVNDYGTSVRIYEISFMNGLVILGYPEVEISYLEFPEDTLVDSNISILFNEYFSIYPVQPPPFEGNPWSYILEMVIEALKVKIWGYFSVWDIVTTLCGIFIATWLLKLLAGG